MLLNLLSNSSHLYHPMIRRTRPCIVYIYVGPWTILWCRVTLVYMGHLKDVINPLKMMSEHVTLH